jgi:hypothetical protein
MKPLYYILIFCLFSEFTQAKNNRWGIYLTSKDFLNRKVTFASKHTRIRLHEVLNKATIVVKTKDSTYTYFKDSIFGYHDKEGNDFRFYHGKIYPIINPAETILIYKVSNVTVQKGQLKMYSYFFSKDAHSKIFPLTMNHILDEFNDNKAYTNNLEIHCHLLEYDNAHGVFKINRLLQITKKINYY